MFILFDSTSVGTHLVPHLGFAAALEIYHLMTVMNYRLLQTSAVYFSPIQVKCLPIMLNKDLNYGQKENHKYIYDYKSWKYDVI